MFYVHVTDDSMMKAVHQFESAYAWKWSSNGKNGRKKGAMGFRVNPESNENTGLFKEMFEIWN